MLWRHAMLVAIPAASVASADVVVPVFTEQAVARGLVYGMTPTPSGFQGFGMGFADLDGDGDQDVIALGTYIGTVGIFENDGTGFFTDRSDSTGIPLMPEATNFSATDFDGDGDLDLFLLRLGSPPSIFRNDGELHFTDVSDATAIDLPVLPMGMATGDVDGDGWIDYLVPHFKYSWPGTELSRHTLWRNNGDGTFTDIAPALGLDLMAMTNAVALFDADGDRDLDLYMSNDRGYLPTTIPNRFYRNDGGSFVEVGQQNGTGLGFFSMGIAIGDIDGNGINDLYCTNAPFNIAPIYGQNPLLVGSPNGLFTQQQVPWGVQHMIYSWACFFFDANNDGLPDLYVVNQFQADSLYLHAGAAPMIDATAASGLGVPGGHSYCAVHGDADGDGDLDILTNRFGGNIRLFINTTDSSASWIKFSIVGEGHDTRALGASVVLDQDGSIHRTNVLEGGNGFLGQNDLDVHFGLANATSADSVTVEWPNSATTRTLTGYPAGVRWLVYPPSRMGDFDGNGRITQSDLSRLSIECGGSVLPGLEMLDMNGDALLDGADFLLMSFALGAPIGDFNGDGLVDGDDLGTLLSEWMTPCSPADLTGDGIVDGNDLGTLLGNWS